ncbi:MAG: hypothetical protein NTZ19_04295 [Bacteroidetes bacterium]|nr:hypothetical protein [Bacteroidota bacterium]
MKKVILFCMLFAGMATVSIAQLGDLTKQATAAAAGAGFDVNKITGDVMKQLTPGLALTAVQNPKVTSAVTDFLGKKASILPLLASNPSKYASQFSSLFSGLQGKLGGILNPSQLTKFLSLKTQDQQPFEPIV